MWKDANLVLDYASFWAPNNKSLLDYVARSASGDTIRNIEICIRHPERAEEILQNLTVRTLNREVQYILMH